MNKILYFFIIFILITGCSLNKNSKFWTNSKSVISENTNNYKEVFPTEEALKKEFNSLPISNLNNSKVIDEAVKEIQTIIKFVGQSFDKKDIEGVSMTLAFLDKLISDTIKLAPQSNYNDMMTDPTVANRLIINKCPWCSASMGQNTLKNAEGRSVSRLIGYREMSTGIVNEYY